MGKAKYVAYVSTYTTLNSKTGIRIFDVDMKGGKLTERGGVEITNSSYMTCSHNDKFLYSITDTGVVGFRILEDGELEQINTQSINGMRGCYLSTDYRDEFLFVAGYHDGKITVLRIHEDGRIGSITDEIFVRGIGEVADRSYFPHVNCVKMSRDNKYLFAADIGMDHINVYELDRNSGKLKEVDIIRCNLDAAPRHILFNRNGKQFYIVNEMSNMIDVYNYTPGGKYPDFEKIQEVSTLNDYHAGKCVSSALKFSTDGKYLVSSNAGDNSVIIYNINKEEGTLSKVLCLPISGSYPKDAALFPDNKHLVSLNNESNTMTFFSVDLEKGLLAMCAKEVKIDKPNCIVFYRLDKEEEQQE
ncbi:MAG: lactonase family protein [Lachnospiraceae bacterium]|nr:lactonase family protein [Lachnospiraceae bacterium]